MGQSHAEITEKAIDRILFVDFKISQKTDAIEAAIKQLAERAGSPDEYHPRQTYWHCDAENFVGCHGTIIEGRMATSSEALADRYDMARSYLGPVLHPLQDFYAHSNWVELNYVEPIELFNVEYTSGLIDQRAQALALGEIRKMWSDITAGKNEATCSPCGLCNCENNLITKKLTSGYYPNQELSRPATPYKCDHGDFTSLSYEGINKDVTSSCMISPHEKLHYEAADLAVSATADFIRSLLGNELDAGQYQRLLGIGSGVPAGPPVAVVIDTTESMQSIINDIVQQIKISTAAASAEYTPSLWMLTPFNDPAMARTMVTNDYSEFIEKLESLRATGGGDCPEPSFEAMYRAASDAPDGTYLYVYTNSAAKDADVYLGPLQTLVAAKNIRVIGGLFGSCSPYSPAFFQLAESSGGQMFVLTSDEATQAAKLNQALAEPGLTRLTQQSLTLDGSEQLVTFVVDPSLEKIVVNVSGITSDGMPPDPTMGNDLPAWKATLVDPSGVPVVSGANGVEVTSMTFGSIAKVQKPQPGLWTVRLQGTGHARVVVEGVGTVSLISLSFLEPAGEPLLKDYFPLTGSPVAGMTYKANARLRGEVQALTIEFHSPTGEILSSHAFESQRVGDGRSVFQGEVTVPEGAFTVHAVATDASGNAIVRGRPAVVSGQHLELTYNEEVRAVPGESLVLDVEVQNYGPEDTFSLKLMDSMGYKLAQSTQSLTLGEGDTETVQLTLDVPEDVALPGNDSLTLALTSASEPSLNTAALIRVDFAKTKAESDDGDLIPNAVDNCPELDNTDQSDIDQDGVGDACDDDMDGDGVVNAKDNCPSRENADQTDQDRDGSGDVCDDNPSCACSVPGKSGGTWSTFMALGAGIGLAVVRRRKRDKTGGCPAHWEQSDDNRSREC